MFDGIKIQDVSVEMDSLLTNDRLTFGGLVDTQTGFILSPVRRAQDRGLSFQLIPRRTGAGYRVEMKGSLHKFYNNGLHNADQYTSIDLLLTLNRLVTDYGFNLFESKINNIEFGVNVELPFAISQVFTNLICYKNQPFAVDSHSQTSYYACHWQRYTVKIYDKGKQKGLNCNLLRFEIRVRKMRYFDGTGVQLRTLADLLNVSNYRLLGALLVSTFNNILFDDPAISSNTLTAKERAFYQQCRNPRYWQTPEDLTPKQAAAHRQRLSRNKDHFRALLNQHGSGWQKYISTLIEQTWTQLTSVDDNLLTRFNDSKRAWQNLSKHDIYKTVVDAENSEETVKKQVSTRHKLTDLNSTVCHELTDLPNAEMSRINPLYSEVYCDKGKPDQLQEMKEVVCPVTGIVIEKPHPRQRFASATLLQRLYYHDRQMFDNIAAQFLTANQAGTSLSQQCYYMAHNIRNAYTNQFNNPLRRLKKYQRGKEGQLPLLFPISQAIRFTDHIQAGIEYRKGTRHEVVL